MSGTRRRAWLLAGTLLAACGAPAERTAPPPRETPTQRFEFVDVAGASGIDVRQIGGDEHVPTLIDGLGCGGAWLDHDGDGDLDLYLAVGATEATIDSGPPDRLLRNDGPGGDGRPKFTDVTEASGLGDRRWSFGVAAADYDNDGDVDLYLLNWGGNRLYRNDGKGHFTDIAPQAGVDDGGWGVSAAWADTDRDGDLDLFVVNYVDFDFATYPRRNKDGGPVKKWQGLDVYVGPRSLIPGRDVFYRNDGDADGDGIPTFVDATTEVGLVPPEDSYGLAARFFDANGDMAPDLYVANDSLINAYFINRGDGTFQEHSILSGLAYNEQGHEQAGMGIAVGELDRDGRPDLAVTNFSHDHDTIYRNEGEHWFTDASFSSGVGGASYLTLGWGMAFEDFDHDGWQDLMVAHGHVYTEVDELRQGVTFRQRNALFRNDGNSRFEEIAAVSGSGMQIEKSSRALLPADYDGDGDLDVAVTNLSDRPDLLWNRGAPGHWLQVALTGVRSNRDGIGALVTVEIDGQRQSREITRTAAYAGSVPPIAHFGLGSATAVQSLEVRWPSGSVTRRSNLEIDRLIQLREE